MKYAIEYKLNGGKIKTAVINISSEASINHVLTLLRTIPGLTILSFNRMPTSADGDTQIGINKICPKTPAPIVEELVGELFKA